MRMLMDETEAVIRELAREKDGFVMISEISPHTELGDDDIDLVLVKRLGARSSGAFYVVPESQYREGAGSRRSWRHPF